MSVAHSAHFASPPYPPVPIGEGIADNGEGFSSTGEGITDTLARLADRLAVLASAAHIMERRAPRDVYARSIAHEACVLALDMRDTLARARAGAPMRSPRIVDAAPSSSPAEAPEDAPDSGEHDARELCSFPGCCHWFNDPCADCLEVERGAPMRSPDGERSTRSTHSTRRDGRSSTRATARQTPPEARSKAQASGCDAHSHARRKGSLASSGGASAAEGGAQ